MSLRRSPFPGFLSLLTGGWRSSDSWVCSAPLALRGLWSSESYVTSGRLLSPAPCFPRCSPSLVGFLPGLTWVPLPLGRFRSFRFTTSLRPGPLLIVSFELVPVVRFGSASELCSRLFRALPAAWFHPCYVSALSPDFLSPFEVSGFWCPARVSYSEALPFPPSQFLLPWGFSAPLKLLSLGVTRVALPLWGFFLSPFFRFKLDFGHGLSLFT